MGDDSTLRPVAEAGLPILERPTQDPAAAGEFAWLGWQKLTRYRRWWAENRLERARRDVGRRRDVLHRDVLQAWHARLPAPQYL